MHFTKSLVGVLGTVKYWAHCTESRNLGAQLQKHNGFCNFAPKVYFALQYKFMAHNFKKLVFAIVRPNYVSVYNPQLWQTISKSVFEIVRPT